MDEHKPQVSADAGSVGIAGDNNHVDQRDQRMNLIWQWVVAAADPAPPPNPDSPHLGDCPHCGRRWLSKLALLCPLCGYSVQAARIAERRRKDLHLMMLMGAALSAVVPLVIVTLWLLGADASVQTWQVASFYGVASVFCGGMAWAIRKPTSAW